MLDSRTLPAISTWDSLPARAPALTHRILELLEAHGSQATFFVLGWFARRYPDIVRDIVRAGHEVASHSDTHPLLFEISRSAVMEELNRSKETLEQISGHRVLGFRAPGFSVRPQNAWALDCVAEAGFVYDSSLLSAKRAHGGMPGTNPVPHVMRTPSGARLVEVPVSTVRLLGMEVPFGGGGYLRLAPLHMTLAAASLARRQGRAFTSYVHPRDLDPQTPRLPLGAWRSFKCYTGLRATERKLASILRCFSVSRYAEALTTAGLL